MKKRKCRGSLKNFVSVVSVTVGSLVVTVNNVMCGSWTGEVHLPWGKVLVVFGVWILIVEQNRTGKTVGLCFELGLRFKHYCHQGVCVVISFFFLFIC